MISQTKHLLELQVFTLDEESEIRGVYVVIDPIGAQGAGSLTIY